MAHQVTVKGQVTIPKRVRDHLGIRPGSGVEWARAPAQPLCRGSRSRDGPVEHRGNPRAHPGQGLN